MLSLLSRFGPVIGSTLRNPVRTIFSPSHFAIDKFKFYTKRIQENNKSSSTLRQSIVEAVSKPDGKIFTEDLKTFLYLAQTDEDIDTIIKAVKKHQSQASLSIFSFNFDVPLMRLLYSLNKTDKALELFLQEDFFKKSYKVTTMLMNKLLEEKRVDDTIKVGTQFIANAKANKKFEVGLDNMKLLAEALLEKNDAAALEFGKSILKEQTEGKASIPDKAIILLALLALEQKQPDVAFEMLNLMNTSGQEIRNNLKIICLIDLNRTDEALKIAEEMSKQGPSKESYKRAFFGSTLNKLLKAVDDSKKAQVQSIIDNETTKKRIFDYDIKDHATRNTERRFDVKNRRVGNNLQNRSPRNDNQNQDQRRVGFNRPPQQSGQQRVFTDRRPQSQEIRNSRDQ